MSQLPNSVSYFFCGVGTESSPCASCILESALTAEYWTHVDNFPCHRPVDKEAEEQLIGLLRHAFVGEHPTLKFVDDWG